MKKTKAIAWEKLSEGTITAKEINNLLNNKHPITMGLLGSNGKDYTTVEVIPARGNKYVVFSQSAKVTPTPYKYLSCAIRKATKEYKQLLRTAKWRVLTK